MSVGEFDKGGVAFGFIRRGDVSATMMLRGIPVLSFCFVFEVSGFVFGDAIERVGDGVGKVGEEGFFSGMLCDELFCAIVNEVLGEGFSFEGVAGVSFEGYFFAVVYEIVGVVGVGVNLVIVTEKFVEAL